MTGLLHDAAVNSLKDTVPGFKTSQCYAEIIKAIGDEAKDEIRPLGFVPDGFTIEIVDDRTHVTLYEVEDHSRLTSKKMASIIELWWALDFLSAFLHLKIVDRWGAVVTTVTDYQLGSLAIRGGGAK